METKNNMSAKAHNPTCDCDCSCCQNSNLWYFGQGHRGLFVVRFLLGIIIILLVFWIGLQVGEFKGYVEGNYAPQMRTGRMMLYDQSGSAWGSDSGASFTAPMMYNTEWGTQSQGAQQAVPTTKATPSTSTKTTK